ncbi:MAG: PaaI family thioesterase [Desulforhopalus sp.]
MTKKSFQDHYPESYRRCYGCGPDNPHGLQLRSFWDGDEAVAVFQPKPYHTAFPGYVYGGLIASLIDCHCTGTASAAAYREAGRELGTEPTFRYVTGSLHVDYHKPTPLGPPIEIRARVVEIKGRKTVIEATASVENVVTARGKMVAIQIPDHLVPQASE